MLDDEERVARMMDIQEMQRKRREEEEVKKRLELHPPPEDASVSWKRKKSAVMKALTYLVRSHTIAQMARPGRLAMKKAAEATEDEPELLFDRTAFKVRKGGGKKADLNY